MLILYALIFLLDISLIDSQCHTCPDGWVRFKASCYLFADVNPLNFTEAKTFCSSQGYNSHLVAMETMEEISFVKAAVDRLRFDGTDYWLGATDAAVEGHWLWSHSGSRLTEEDWAPGQPNDYHHHEDCATFAHTKDFQWQDSYCTSRHLPLCELEVSGSSGFQSIG